MTTLAFFALAYAPLITALGIGIFWACLAWWATSDPGQCAFYGVIGTLVGMLSAGAALAEIAHLVRVRETNEEDGESETEPPPATPTDYTRLPPVRQAFSSQQSGFVEIKPAIPDFVSPAQMQVFAWGLRRQNRRFTFAEWRGNFSRDGQFVPLRDFMLEQRMIRGRNPNHPQGGIEITGRGHDWLENIVQAFGPPPR